MEIKSKSLEEMMSEELAAQGEKIVEHERVQSALIVSNLISLGVAALAIVIAV